MALIMSNPRFRAVDPDTGSPLVGGKLYTYEVGTVTPKATYTDQGGGTANPNPVELDGNGEASVWLGSGGYKFKLTDAYDVELWTIDNIQVADVGSFSSLTVSGASTLAAVSASGQITSTVSDGTAPLVVTSTTKVANLNADKVDGADWAAPAAIGSGTPAAGSFTTLGASGASALDGTITGKANIEQESANAAQWIRGQLSEEITLNTGGTTTDSTANLLPANSIIEGVVARVTEAITVAANWDLGDATQGQRFLNNSTGLALGSTEVALLHRDPTVASADLGPVQSSAAKLRITTDANPGAGKIRVTVFYSQFVAPTS
jgi:hypothetical protein